MVIHPSGLKNNILVTTFRSKWHCINRWPWWFIKTKGSEAMIKQASDHAWWQCSKSIKETMAVVSDDWWSVVLMAHPSSYIEWLYLSVMNYDHSGDCKRNLFWKPWTVLIKSTLHPYFIQKIVFQSIHTHTTSYHFIRIFYVISLPDNLSMVINVISLPDNLSMVIYVISLPDNQSMVIYVISLPDNLSMVIYVISLPDNLSMVIYIMSCQIIFIWLFM